MKEDDDPDLRELPLRSYRPRSMLRTPTTPVPRARVPAVDAHTHLGRWLTGGWAAGDARALLESMERCNVRAFVNADGRWGEELEANLDRYDRAFPGRVATLCQLDWRETNERGFGERLAGSLRRSADAGAAGLKVWKDLGLHVRDPDGALLVLDDERLAPVWKAAGECGLPVLIHVADPIAFFGPVDATNERLEELLVHPDWSFADASRYPRFDALLEGLARLVHEHPGTVFIGAHVGCAAEDLDRVAGMLEASPNFHVDIAARIAELGRRPRAARAFIERFADRVLFGTDGTPPGPADAAIHFRFLETCDESFDYHADELPPQGRWQVHGLGLSDEVLRSVYAANASRLFPTLA